MSIDENTAIVPATEDAASSELDEPRDSAMTQLLLAGRYRLSRRIGKGGMGEVIAARDEQVGRDVAIKRMRAAAPTDRAIQRFLREASIQGRLEHPAIVPVHEIGRESDGLPFFVMKKLTGTTLGKVISEPAHRDKFNQQVILRAFAEVCLAVELAHVRGIVHRDLKPDNILLGDFGEVYILDWGVAKIIGEDESSEFADVGSGSGENATIAGTTIGTGGYMPPEQALGHPDIDARTDVYALGCVLFEILAGEPLHPRGSAGMRSAVAGCDARPSLRAPKRDIAPELDALCVAATATDRAERLASARELGDRVVRFLDGDRDLAMRRQLARGHLARAQAAFAAGDTEELRKVAMREAGAAIALDPALEGAAALVTRLMLVPPKSTPREVEDAILADEVRAVKDNARAGRWALIACFLFTPILWWIAPRGGGYVAAYVGAIAVNSMFYLAAYRGATPRTSLVILGNAVVIVLLARMYGPLLVAPGVASVLSIAMILNPRISTLDSAFSVGALFIAAAFAPLLLERLDIVSHTISIDDTGILFRAPGVGGDENPALLVGTIYGIGLIIGCCAMSHAMRTRAHDALRHLHLQAWQLRQLVPEDRITSQTG